MDFFWNLSKKYFVNWYFAWELNECTDFSSNFLLIVFQTKEIHLNVAMTMHLFHNFCSWLFNLTGIFFLPMNKINMKYHRQRVIDISSLKLVTYKVNICFNLINYTFRVLFVRIIHTFILIYMFFITFSCLKATNYHID